MPEVEAEMEAEAEAEAEVEVEVEVEAEAEALVFPRCLGLCSPVLGCPKCPLLWNVANPSSTRWCHGSRSGHAFC